MFYLRQKLFPMDFQKLLSGLKSLRECDFLAFELGEVLAEGVGGVKISDAV